MISVKGFNAAFKELERTKAKGKKMVRTVAMQMAGMIAEDARAGVPVDLGTLKASIGTRELENGAVVFVGEAHGAFQEFGTILYVDIPPELAEEAKKYKGYKNKNSEDFLEAIKAWCLRKGIEERAAYPIAMTILKKGLHPQPYFYPAINKNREKLASLIQKELDNA